MGARGRPPRPTAFYALLVDEVAGALLLPGGGDGEAAREHLPHGQHRARERARDALRTSRASTSGRSSTPRRPSRSGSCRSTPGPASAVTASRSTRPTWPGSPGATPAGRSGLVETAQDINAAMPAYVAGRVVEVLNDRGTSVRGARILALGVTYKPDVGDLRESAAIEVLSRLRRKGARGRGSTTRSSSGSTPTASTLSRSELTARAGGAGGCRAAAHPARRVRPGSAQPAGSAAVRRPQRRRAPAIEKPS